MQSTIHNRPSPGTVFDKTEPTYYPEPKPNPDDPVQTTTQGDTMQSPIDNPQSAIPNTLLPPSTGIDTMQQNAAKCGENSCAHAREDYSTTLSFKQIKFLRCLLTERTIAAATAKAGVHRGTFYRWLEDPAFKAEYEHCRTLTIAKAEISALSLDAVELLHECLKEGYHPNVRVHAAGTILRNAQKLTQAANPPDPHTPNNPNEHHPSHY